MKKFNLISLSAILSIILLGCGSTSSSVVDDILITQEDVLPPVVFDSEFITKDNNVSYNIENKINIDYKIPSISNADRDRFLNEINNARAVARDCGSAGHFPAVSKLTWNTQLYEACYEHNYDMQNANIFSHNGSATQYDITGVLIEQASTPYNRVVNTNYFNDANYYGIVENIAMGPHDIKEVVNYWLEDDLHCSNIMREEFTEMGISKVLSSKGYYHWTNILGYK
jgi:uncharacterized protein YkwD